MIDQFDELEKLNAAIDIAVSSLAEHEPDSKEYATVADQLTKLMKIKDTIARIRLANFEATEKSGNDQLTMNQKEAELQNKKLFEARQAELREQELNLKQEELRIREKEAAATSEAKFAEAEARRAETQSRGRISKETLAVIGANLIGIGMIIGYERVNVITSKALGFVAKSR